MFAADQGVQGVMEWLESVGGPSRPREVTPVDIIHGKREDRCSPPPWSAPHSYTNPSRLEVAEEWKLFIFKGVGKDFKGVDNIRKRKKGKRS